MITVPAATEAAPARHALVAVEAETAVAAALDVLAEEARGYADQAKSANTRRAYRADWADFTAWCQTHRLDALPASPATLALYLTDLAAHWKPSTIQRRLAPASGAPRARPRTPRLRP